MSSILAESNIGRGNLHKVRNGSTPSTDLPILGVWRSVILHTKTELKMYRSNIRLLCAHQTWRTNKKIETTLRDFVVGCHYSENTESDESGNIESHQHERNYP